MARPVGHLFYIDTYREKIDIWYVASARGPVTKIVQIITTGQNGSLLELNCLTLTCMGENCKNLLVGN